MLQEIHLIKFSSILFTESNSLDINSDLLSANSCPSAPLKNNSQFTSIDQAHIECLICPRCLHYPKAKGMVSVPRSFSLVEKTVWPKTHIRPCYVVGSQLLSLERMSSC